MVPTGEACLYGQVPIYIYIYILVVGIDYFF